MSEIPGVGPYIPNGGLASDYAVEITSTGSYGTRNLQTRKFVPHVVAQQPLENLAQQTPIQPLGDVGAAALQTGLSAANLAVGVLNLGVSAWTAYKVHQLDKSVHQVLDQQVQMGCLIEQSVQHLDGLIRSNALMLGFLADHQQLLHADIVLLQRGMQSGFNSVLDAVESQDARNKAIELEFRMRSVLRYYELCSRELMAGRTAPYADLRQIVDGASQLIAWLDTQINVLPIGHCNRLPLLQARVFALHLEIEARLQLGEAGGARQAEVLKMQKALQQEALALVEDASVYVLAQQRSVLIEQYVMLIRVLNRPVTMVTFSNGQVMPFVPKNMLHWDNDLVRAKALLRAENDAIEQACPATLEIRSLAEHRSWAALKKSSNDIDRDELLDELGMVEWPAAKNLPEKVMRELLVLAPTIEKSTRTQILKELPL